jgi:hypothetical protein
VQCWRRGQAAASDDCDFKRSERERDREIEGQRERGREIKGATKAGRVDSTPILMSSERALYLELRCRLSLRKHLVAA